MLYAQLNAATQQMIGDPRELPAIWTDGSGATIGKFNQLPDTILYLFGWIPVVYEELPDKAGFYHAQQPVYEPEGPIFLFPAIARDLGLLIVQAEEAIDLAAATACSRYISTGAGQEMRYMQKHAQALRYFELAESDVPIAEGDPEVAMVIAEAEACGVTALEKATEIVAVRDAWLRLAAQIESLRISGKVVIRTLTDPVAIITHRDQTIASLEAI